MTYPVRWIPAGRHLVEVSNRTIQARYLLRPTEDVRDIILGVLGRAQRRFRMDICMFTFMSNHFHMLLVPENMGQLAKFMAYVGGEIGREISHMANWGAKVWAGRYKMAVVASEEGAQVDRLRYLLAHGVKEGLVGHPTQWLGANGSAALLSGERLRGHWYDRSRQSLARRRGKPAEKAGFAHAEEVILTPLPCWGAQGLDTGAIRARAADLVEQIAELHALSNLLERHSEPGHSELARSEGPLARILALPWDFRPEAPKSSPHKLFLAASRAERQELYGAYSRFLAAYRKAAEAWKRGERSARFPAGSFPPAPPFVLAQ